MNESLRKAFEEVCLKRAEIKENFLKTWMAVNVPDGELTPDIFNKIVLVERQKGTECHYFVAPKDDWESSYEERQRLQREREAGLERLEYERLKQKYGE